MKKMIPMFAALAALACVAAEPNTLTDAEKAAGWKLLWDGRTLDGWVGERNGLKEAPKKGWQIKDGVLTVLPQKRIVNGKWENLPKEVAALGGGGDLVTKESFKDFDLMVDFKLTDSANSGIKYFYDNTRFGGTCEEYQILEPGHPDSNHGKNGNRRVASLYDMIPANAEKIVKPVGEWNTARIVSRGNTVEHWLNGQKVLAYERGSEEFRKAVAASKYKSNEKNEKKKPGPWGETAEGRIKLQDHNDSTVSFRNIKIKKL